MSFMCQKDSFLQKLATRVVSCEACTEPVVEYGREEPFSGYAVEFEDTILFPAGGGQPHDRGMADGEPVLQVCRRGARALHYMARSLPVGAAVTLTLDWERRFDHMQQHSGQHLLSALLERRGLHTSSWWLGAEESHVALATPSVAEEVLAAVEAQCNQFIRDAVPVTVTIASSIDEGHTRGLPADCGDTVRVVHIGDIDSNMCCGTHVNNLSQLQCIKLLGAEAGKKGETNVKFVVGARALRTFQALLHRQRALTSLLNNDPGRHEELVRKLQRNLKLCGKSLQSTLAELAELQVRQYQQADPKPLYIMDIRKSGTGEWLRALSRGLEGAAVTLLAACEDPDKPGEGQLVLQGPPAHLDTLAPKVSEALRVKAARRPDKLQGKAQDLGPAAVARCRQLLQQHFHTSVVS